MRKVVYVLTKDNKEERRTYSFKEAKKWKDKEDCDYVVELEDIEEELSEEEKEKRDTRMRKRAAAAGWVD